MRYNLESRTVPLNVRIPKTLKRLIKECVALDAHSDVSDFVKEALREKIHRDAPELYKTLFSADKIEKLSKETKQ